MTIDTDRQNTAYVRPQDRIYLKNGQKYEDYKKNPEYVKPSYEVTGETKQKADELSQRLAGFQKNETGHIRQYVRWYQDGWGEFAYGSEETKKLLKNTKTDI